MINIFYDDRMINSSETMSKSVSKSPIKPKLVVDALKKGNFKDDLCFKEVTPLVREDFLIAHTEQYVDDFFNGVQPLANSNNIPWSQELADSVKFTNGSLHSAIKFAVENENSFSFAPVSGFHHAKPHRGQGFCTFSGQVIASVKIWRETGKVGAYIDADGHVGGSIDDSKIFVPDVNKAISLNYNAKGQNKSYIDNLKKFLSKELGPSIINGKTHYIVFCHGADSHIEDDLVGNDYVDTKHWLEVSHIFYTFIKTLRVKGFTIPVISTLFGGYRKDNYKFVVNLHRQDIEIGNKILGNKNEI